MNPGKLDILATIQEDKGTTKNLNGEHIRNWQTYCYAWINKLTMSAREGVVSDQVVNIMTEEFKCRTIDITGVTPKMRITFSGDVYDIIEVGYIDRMYSRLICTKIDNS